MKATQESAFRPVTLTLQTQHEVDAIYAVLNNSAITTALRLGDEDYAALKPFINKQNADVLWGALQERRKR